MLQADVWLASATFLAFAAVGVFVIVRSALLGARCNLARYNRVSLGGMSEEQIEATMRQEPTERKGIGIRNVNDRLKIYFGRG